MMCPLLPRRFVALCVAVWVLAGPGFTPSTPGGAPVVSASASARQSPPVAVGGVYVGQARHHQFFDDINEGTYDPFPRSYRGELTDTGAGFFTGFFDELIAPGHGQWHIFDIDGTVDSFGELSGTAKLRWEGVIDDYIFPAVFEGLYDGTTLTIRFIGQGATIGNTTYLSVDIPFSGTNELGDCDLEVPPDRFINIEVPAAGKTTVFVVRPPATSEDCKWAVSVQDNPDWIRVSPSGGTGRNEFTMVVDPIQANPASGACDTRTAIILIRTRRVERRILITQEGHNRISCSCPFFDTQSLTKAGPDAVHYGRRFRDEVLARSARGAEYTRLYYRFADETSAILETNPWLLTRAARLLDRQLPALRSLVDDGRASVTRADLDEIDALLADIAASGSPELREAVARVRLDLEKLDLRAEYGLDVRPTDRSVAKQGLSEDLPFTSFAGLGRLRPGEVIAVAAHSREYLRASRNHAGEVLDLLASNPWLALRAPGALACVTSAVESVVRTGSATLDAEARAELETFLSGLDEVASPELRRTVGALRGDLRSPHALEGFGVRSIPAATDSAARAAYERLPVAFVAGPGSGYSAHGLGYGLSVSSSGMTLDLSRASRERAGGERPRSARFGMRLVRADPAARPTARGVLPGTRNYFVGNDPASWRTGVSASSEVVYAGVYPGIDVVYYGSQRRLEYDFRLAPGADPADIRLRTEGADSLRIDERGDLVVETGSGQVRQQRPVAYQEVDGATRPVEAGYELTPGGEIAIRLGSYDRTRPLVVDPVVDFASYLGGSDSDMSSQVVVDAAGNIYLSGTTSGGGFPTSGGVQTSFGGGVGDAYVVKLNATGSDVIFATYLGGSGEETGSGLAVDPAGSVYVVGATTSTNFPVASALQSSLRGERDAFLTRLSATGSALMLSTYLGGAEAEAALAVAVSGKFVYVTGVTTSTDFRISAKAFSKSSRGGSDAFVMKFKKGGAKIAYSTYFGGSGFDLPAGIAVDTAGNAYVAGLTSSADLPTNSPAQAELRGLFDGFVTKFNPKGSALVYSTFLGGSDVDGAAGIAIDGAGNAYVTGATASTDFPVAGALQASYGGGLLDGFATKLGPTGATLVYSTYLGGSAEDRAYRVAVDAAGRAHLTGLTASGNFPVRNAIQGQLNGEGFDAFVTSIEPTGSSLAASTYLGGRGDDAGVSVAVGASGTIIVVGETSSTDFPAMGAVQGTNAGGFDAFVVRLGAAAATSP